jgi:predicted anti-sigma-YlaC factor YlaD
MKNINVIAWLLLGLLVASCSINKMAMRSSNPEFIGKRIPGVIEKNEKKLAKNPEDQALILETGSLFIMYANAFIQGPAEMMPPYQYEEKDLAKQRAKELYLRGTDILYTGLDKRFPGFSSAPMEEVKTYLAKMEKGDVPILYWTVAGTLAAFSLDPFDLGLGVKIPALTAMINRAYQLDPDFNKGALDEFYVLFYGSLPESMGGDKSQVGTYFNRAIEKSKGLSASPYVSYAETFKSPPQDYASFKEYLEKALAIDPDADPSNRLVNILSQRKARYLLDHAEDFFLEVDGGDESDEEY